MSTSPRTKSKTRKVSSPQGEKPDGSPNGTASPTAGPDPQTLAAHRRRLRVSAGLVKDMLHLNGEPNPKELTLGASMIVVARIIEALMKEQGELPTEELLVISKVVAEQRRLDLSERPSAAPRESVSEAPTRPIENAVGQIYGAGPPPRQNDSPAAVDAGAPPPCKDLTSDAVPSSVTPEVQP